MHPIPDLTRTALLAGALLTVPVIAQDTPATPQTLKFPGGSFTQLVEALRADSAGRGAAVNIVFPETANSVDVPALELTGASVQDALRAVSTILAPVVHIEVESYQDHPNSATVHAIQIFPMTRKEAPPPPKTLGIFSLATLTRSEFLVEETLSIPAETALTAIETALDLDGEPDAEIRFHADSGLLFVRGTPGQTGIVGDVIRQLERDLQGLNLRARAARGPRPPGAVQETPAAAPPADPTAPPIRRR